MFIVLITEDLSCHSESNSEERKEACIKSSSKCASPPTVFTATMVPKNHKLCVNFHKNCCLIHTASLSEILEG